jgi:hypothetical protein
LKKVKVTSKNKVVGVGGEYEVYICGKKRLEGGEIIQRFWRVIDGGTDEGGALLKKINP